MDIRQLEVFLSVMEHSSLTRAAERLCLSPAAVSLQLHHLAAELHTELFVRSGRRLVPSEQAFRLAGQAREILKMMGEIRHGFAADPASDARPFHFATGASTLIYRLGPSLRMLRKRFPNADFHVTVAATEVMVAGLLERRFDLALISLPSPRQDLRIVPLYEEELLLLRPAKRPIARSVISVIQPAELAGVPFLLYPQSSNMRTIIDQFLGSLGVHPKVIMEADDTQAIKRMVEAGYGYSILPERALHGRGFRFQTLRVAGHRLVRQQALAMAKTEYPRGLTLAVAQFLQTALQTTAQ